MSFKLVGPIELLKLPVELTRQELAQLAQVLELHLVHHVWTGAHLHDSFWQAGQLAFRRAVKGSFVLQNVCEQLVSLSALPSSYLCIRSRTFLD